MRKLVKLVVVDNIVPHTNADALELAIIGGWQCCVKKGEFKPGDSGVYFEVDSMLPLDVGFFEFLSGRNEREHEGRKYARIKTMKLRGELSQGLLLPISHFGDVFGEAILGWGALEEEDKLTEVMQVVKYEPAMPACLAGNAKGSFPSFIPKTDQERVQNIKREYEKCVASGELFEVTYKLDGSSFTAFAINEGDDYEEGFNPRIGVCSRNLELKIDENEGNAFVQTLKNYSLDVKLHDYLYEQERQIAIQGEMVGPGIQKNFEGLESVQLYIYNIFDIDKQEYLLPNEARMICEELDLDYVPLFDSPMRLPETIEEVIAMADGESGLNGKYREGLVFKSLERDFSFKVISNKYLLKEE
jgi:RNA ligase (TIGR02306 family)